MQGSAGTAGPAGATGPRGASGARPARPARQDRRRGQDPRISCRLSGSRVTCRVVAAKGGSGGSGGNGGGTNTGGGEGLRLRLSRASRLYATGSRAAKSKRTNVRLHGLRKVERGKYTLAVDIGDDVTVRIPITLR